MPDVVIQLCNTFRWLVQGSLCLLFDWIATPSARNDVERGWIATVADGSLAKTDGVALRISLTGFASFRHNEEGRRPALQPVITRRAGLPDVVIQSCNAFGWLVQGEVCLLFDWIATPSARNDVTRHFPVIMRRLGEPT